MIIISWNVRGAAGSDFKRVFREMTNSYKLDMVVLSETRVSSDRASSIIGDLGFERFVKVDALGFLGGLWVLWNPINIYVEPITTAFPEIFSKFRLALTSSFSQHYILVLSLPLGNPYGKNCHTFQII